MADGVLDDDFLGLLPSLNSIVIALAIERLSGSW